MKHVHTYEEFLNEATFKDLQSFLDDVVTLVQKNKKDFSLENTRGIQLDVVGGFGFKQETVVIDASVIAKELGIPEKFIEELVSDTFKKYKTVLKKGTIKFGSLYVTYKK